MLLRVDPDGQTVSQNWYEHSKTMLGEDNNYALFA
jgi:hypothetical protein